jgi:hypothetical protein
VRLAHLRVGAYRQDISFERSGNWVEHAKCVWHILHDMLIDKTSSLKDLENGWNIQGVFETFM